MLKSQVSLSQEHAYCALPFTRLIINAYGDLSMCCYQLHQLGSILEKDILEIWRSPLAEEIREQTRQGKLHPVCKSWNSCPYFTKDRIPYDFPTHRNNKFPLSLEICLPNSHCNIGGENPSEENPACIMCCRNYEFKPQPNITNILVEKAKPLIPYLNNLQILGIAEPFWKNAAIDILEQLDFHKWKSQIEFSTNHNGTCFHPNMQESFIKVVEKSYLQWSLDAASPLTYRKIRRIDAYDKILENLKNWIRIKPPGHYNTIYNNINLLNVHEMVSMVECAHDMHVDSLIFIPTQDQSGRVHMDEFLLNHKNKDIFASYADASRKRAEELGLVVRFDKPFHKPNPSLQELIQIT